MRIKIKRRANDRRHVRVVLLMVLLVAIVAWGYLGRYRPKVAEPVATAVENRTEIYKGTHIHVRTGVPYAYSKSLTADELALDLYIPEGARKLPILIYLHGGGWLGGNKNGIGPKSLSFAASGMIVASVNYRLRPLAAAPNSASDIAAAIAYIRKNADEIGGDGDRLVLMGHSSGAHLAALTLCDARYLTPYPGAAAAVRGLVLLDGSAYHVPRMMESMRGWLFTEPFGTDSAMWKEVSPYHFAINRAGLPPMLLVHANEDALRQQAANDLAEASARGGGKSVLLSAPTKTHYTVDIDLGNPADPLTMQVMKFIREVVGQ